MDETQNTPQPQANPEPQPTPPASVAPSQPAPIPTPSAPTPQPSPSPQPAPTPHATSPSGRTFYKTFSPRILNFPFSLAIDKNRAKQAAIQKGYQIPEPPMYFADGGMFWGNVYVEVKNADPADTNVVTLTDEQITAKEKV